MARAAWGAALVAAMLAGAPPPATAAAHPTVVDIRVADDPVTALSTVLREMSLRVGDPADPAAIAASRQALLDLELFREVEITTEPADGGVALVVALTEKRYLLPVPAFSSSSDGDYAYGAYVRWNNLFGLNQTFDIKLQQGKYPDDRRREREDTARIRYMAPHLWGERGLRAELEHFDRDAPVPGGTFDERIHRVELTVTRDHRDSRPRTGWSTAAGVHWRLQDAGGPLAPPAEGHTTALVLGADYSDVRFHVYSETGRLFSLRLEAAHDGWLSDYGYRQLDARFVHHIAVPGGEHRTLNLIAAAGVHQGGVRRLNAYGLGGSSLLRGYELDHALGERYAYGAVEYLHPLFGLDWLRLLVVGEAGATGGGFTPDARSGGPYASVGAGLRVRVTWFMNLEFELGIAYPLRGRDGAQFFAGDG